METIGKVGAKLSALGIAAGVFAQIDDGSKKDLGVFKEVVDLIFNATGIEPVDWEALDEVKKPLGRPAK